VTGNNWEGTGVIPDVSAPADHSLRLAHGLATKSLLRSAPEGSSHEKLKRELTLLEIQTDAEPTKPWLGYPHETARGLKTLNKKRRCIGASVQSPPSRKPQKPLPVQKKESHPQPFPFWTLPIVSCTKDNAAQR
jgi:hypothetical protein